MVFQPSAKIYTAWLTGFSRILPRGIWHTFFFAPPRMQTVYNYGRPENSFLEEHRRSRVIAPFFKPDFVRDPSVRRLSCFLSARQPIIIRPSRLLSTLVSRKRSMDPGNRLSNCIRGRPMVISSGSWTVKGKIGIRVRSFRIVPVPTHTFILDTLSFRDSALLSSRIGMVHLR